MTPSLCLVACVMHGTRVVTLIVWLWRLPQAGNKLGDEGAQALAPEIAKLTQLQELNLQGECECELSYAVVCKLRCLCLSRLALLPNALLVVLCSRRQHTGHQQC